MKNFKDFLNEGLKPGYETKELEAMLRPVMNQVYEATFTEEARREGIEDKDEQIMAHIMSRMFDYDRDAILKAAAYALEDANFRKEYEQLMKMAGE